MDHQICDACECVSHCRKNGCVPQVSEPRPAALSTPPAATPAATGEGVTDERAMFIAWLGRSYPHAYDEMRAAHLWDNSHVAALAWKARAALAQPAPVAAPAPAASEEDARIRAGGHERNLSAQAWATLRPPMTRITGVSSGVLERAAKRASPSTPEPDDTPLETGEGDAR